MKHTRALTALAAAAVFAVPANVQAQAVTGSILATATVAAVLSVSNQANLAFGSVFQGIPTTVATDDAGAGAFAVVSGVTSAEITIDLVFPAGLDEVGPGVDVIPFSAPTAEFSLTNDASVGVPFTGGALAQQTVNVSGGGLLWIFVGGTVSPTAAQTPGDYTGDIDATVDYTGN